MGRGKRNDNNHTKSQKRKMGTNPDLDEIDRPDNESKQKPSARKKVKSVVKNWIFKVKKDRKMLRKDKATNQVIKKANKLGKNKRQTTAANFLENGDEVLFEVEGQAMDFTNEEREGSPTNMDETGELNSDSDMEDCEGEISSGEIILSQNNNASRVRNELDELSTSMSGGGAAY